MEVQRELEVPEVWKDPIRSAELNKERSKLEDLVNKIDKLEIELFEARELLLLIVQENELALLPGLLSNIEKNKKIVESFEFRKMFSNPLDPSNAYLDIQSGSGGTEAQDWAEMILRMYLKWSDSMEFEVEILGYTPGDVAGIKHATARVIGDYAYGWLRTETGVHRLVRKSPFDSNSKRHTSFASAFISPEVNNDIEIEIDPSDLRTDVYRASGAGGQHVNKTESAVRITHTPSGIVVQCQNDRSQHKNKATAMKQLKAKLYERERQLELEKADAIENQKSDIGWGNQIRSYVLDQSRVKDLRTGLESGNPTSVLNGNIRAFLEESLKSGV